MSARIFGRGVFLFQKNMFYAVKVGRQTGIYKTWAECEKQVKGIKGAKFRKFTTEKEALDFIQGKSTTIQAVASKHRISHSVTNATRTITTSRRTLLCDPKPLHQSETETVVQTNTISQNGESSTEQIAQLDRPIVYCDGCCSNNGKEGAVAGIGVYWAPGHPQNVSERLSGLQTNQRAELNAATRALETALELGLKTVEVRSDSMYTINAITKWIHQWKKNDWQSSTGSDVKNQADIKALDHLCNLIDVRWVHVPAHVGVYGNEQADQFSRRGASLPLP